MSPTARKTLAVIGAAVFFCCFFALGTWQLHRRAWKLALIARVDSRAHAPATAVPPPAEWPQVSAARDEYRHVQATGVYLHAAETLVQASTELGSGFWVITPLRLTDGSVVLVNRGFVPEERRSSSAHAGGESSQPLTVSGLLRVTEPRAFLRHNDALANRWYSRDVPAIAAARHLAPVAPYFIDSEGGPQGRTPAQVGFSTASATEAAEPIGGLTVIAFHNNHLVYAITWYTLALMTLSAGWHGIRTGGYRDP